MSKKITVLAMAVGVVAAMVLPTSASATWKHHNQAIQQDVQLGLTGNIRFQTGFGGAECTVTTRVKFLANQTTGSVETLTPHPVDETTNCKGFGAYAPCQTHNLSPQTPNWTFHTALGQTQAGSSHQALVITTQPVTATPTGGIFCPGKFISFTGGTLLAVPTQPNTFTDFNLEGTLLTHKQTNSGAVDQENVQITGTLQIEDPELRNTYSI